MKFDKFAYTFKVVLITALFSAITWGAVCAGDKETTAQLTTKEPVAVTKTKPTAQMPQNELVVFSFYDTQLEVMCYMSNSGIDCILAKHLSKNARAFITDRVTKYKDDLGVGYKIPRIVPLDH